jgi:hypothetical protein
LGKTVFAQEIFKPMSFWYAKASCQRRFQADQTLPLPAALGTHLHMPFDIGRQFLRRWATQ